MKTILAALLLAMPATIPTNAGAQTAANPAPDAAGTAGMPGGGGLLGSAGGLLGGAMPSIGSIGAGNAAGLLGYCVKNKLLGATGTSTGMGAAGAAGVLGRLTGQSGVRSSPGFTAGQAGQVQAPGGQTLSLESLHGQAKTQLCKMVLGRARSFL